jgi:hypothetical protein
MKSNQNVVKTSFMCCLLLMMLGAVESRANNLSVLTAVKLNSEINDNVRYTETKKTSDFVENINPKMSLNYTSERLDVTTLADVNFERYLDEKDLDNEKQDYQLNGDYQVAERTSLSSAFSFNKDNTQDSELRQTGILTTERVDRERYDGRITLNHSLSELVSSGVEYTYGKTNYKGSDRSFSNNDSHGVSVFFRRDFNDSIDTLTIRPNFQRTKSDSIETNNYGVSFGWRRLVSETVQFNNIFGVRYTESKSKNLDSTEKNWGGTVDISFAKKGPNLRSSIGYRRDIGYSHWGSLIETDKVYGSTAYRFTERLDFELLGDLVISKTETDFQSDSGKLVEITPSLSYDLTKNSSLLMEYQYTWNLDDTEAVDKVVEVNRFWVGIAFKFHKFW